MYTGVGYVYGECMYVCDCVCVGGLYMLEEMCISGGEYVCVSLYVYMHSSDILNAKFQGWRGSWARPIGWVTCES